MCHDMSVLLPADLIFSLFARKRGYRHKLQLAKASGSCFCCQCFVDKSIITRRYIDSGLPTKNFTMRDLELQSLKSLRSVPLVHIRISNLSFKETSVTVSREDLVSAVKGRVLGSEYSKECSSYKLLLAKTNRVLADDKTLEEEKIEDNGEHGTMQ